MITTIGTDIIEVSRIQDGIEKLKDPFIKKIFTKKEIEYCEKTGMMKYQHYAARFAAKEAIFKAVSSKLKDKYEINWQNAEILPDKYGKPNVNFIKLPDYLMEDLEYIDISLSHIKEIAIATCCINWRK